MPRRMPPSGFVKKERSRQDIWFYVASKKQSYSIVVNETKYNENRLNFVRLSCDTRYKVVFGDIL